MANVVLLIANDGPSRTAVIAAVRAHTSLAISEIYNRLDNRQPVITEELFPRDGDRASRVMSLTAALEELGVAYEMYEVPQSQHFDKNRTAHLFRLDRNSLHRIIQRNAQELERQRELGFREAEDNGGEPE